MSWRRAYHELLAPPPPLEPPPQLQLLELELDPELQLLPLELDPELQLLPPLDLCRLLLLLVDVAIAASSGDERIGYQSFLVGMKQKYHTSPKISR